MYFKATHPLFLIPAGIFCFIFLLSSSGGRNDARAGAIGDLGTCSSCHGGNNGTGISLTGAPSVVIPGNTYPLTLTVSGGGGSWGGFQILATGSASSNTQFGTFTPSTGTRLNPLDRLVHDAPEGYTMGSASWTFDWTAPASGTNVSFFYAGVAADGTGGNDLDATANGSILNIPFPVELVRFSAQRKGTEALLTWETASEVDASHFDVLRSIDGVNFTSIGEVDANSEYGNGGKYTYTDQQLPKQSRVYYRLEQYDLSGEKYASKVVTVQSQVLSSVKLLSANPIGQSELQFSLNDVPEGASARLFASDGSLLGGITNTTPELNIMDVTNAPSGLLYLQILNAEGELVAVQKLVKL